MSSPSFTDPTTWAGGFYELAIYIGERDEARSGAVLRALSTYGDITGWYARQDVDPTEQVRVQPTGAELVSGGRWYGFASIPGYPQLVCGCLAITDDEGDDNWVELCIPIGALVEVDDRVGGFPLGDDGGALSLTWRAALDAWFADVARYIYKAIAFEVAFIGVEVQAPDLLDAYRASGMNVPESRYDAWLVRKDDELLYYPATG